MPAFAQRALQTLAAMFSVRVALAFMSSSAVTAGVAGPLALQALDARSEQAAAAAPAAESVDPSAPADPAMDPPADDSPTLDPPADNLPADDPADDPPADDPPANDPPADDPPANDPPANDPVTRQSPKGGATGTPAPDPAPGNPAPNDPAAPGGTNDGESPTTPGGTAGGGTDGGESPTTPGGTGGGTTGGGTPPAQPVITVSLHAGLSPALYLDGALIWGDTYLAVRPPAGTTRVRFWLDGPSTGSPDRTDNSTPFTFTDAGVPLDAESLSEGTHTLRVIADLPGQDAVTASATFTVRYANGE